MIIIGIVFIGIIGSDGMVMFMFNQDKSLGLKMLFMVKLMDNMVFYVLLDVIFMVFISLDMDKVLFWGNMLDMIFVNGKMLYCLWLQVELLLGVMLVFINGVYVNNEYWVMMYMVDNIKWDIVKQCGSLSKVLDNNDLLMLYYLISLLGWLMLGYFYLFKLILGGGMYCGVDENIKQ